MFDGPQDDVVNNDEDDFAKHFDAFAAGKPPPDHEDPPSETPPEGNVPEEPASAPPEPEAAPAEPPESDTSGTETGAAPPAPAEAPDPWAQVPAELKAQYEQTLKERDEARHKAQSDASRVAALSRKINTLQSSAPAPLATPEPSEAQKALDQKIVDLRKEYPEVAEPLIEMIQAQRDELGTVKQQLTALTDDQQAAYIAQEQQSLEAIHPDWRQVAAQKDFAEWLQVQPANIQRLAQSYDAHETGVALTLFKAEMMVPTGQTQEAPPAPTPTATATDAKRSQQLEGGRDVPSRPAPATSGPPEDFDAAFQHFAAIREEKARKAAIR